MSRMNCRQRIDADVRSDIDETGRGYRGAVVTEQLDDVDDPVVFEILAELRVARHNRVFSCGVGAYRDRQIPNSSHHTVRFVSTRPVVREDQWVDHVRHGPAITSCLPVSFRYDASKEMSDDGECPEKQRADYDARRQDEVRRFATRREHPANGHGK